MTPDNNGSTPENEQIPAGGDTPAPKPAPETANVETGDAHPAGAPVQADPAPAPVAAVDTPAPVTPAPVDPTPAPEAPAPVDPTPAPEAPISTATTATTESSPASATATDSTAPAATAPTADESAPAAATGTAAGPTLASSNDTMLQLTLTGTEKGTVSVKPDTTIGDALKEMGISNPNGLTLRDAATTAVVKPTDKVSSLTRNGVSLNVSAASQGSVPNTGTTASKPAATAGVTSTRRASGG